MQYPMKLLLGGLAAALALSAAVTGADARRFEVSNQAFLAKWGTGNKLTFEIAGVNVMCKVTFEGSFHSKTFSKVCGELIGYITNARLTHPCENGEAWFQNGVETLPNGETPNTLPWHLVYDSFTGTLPRITGIRTQVIGAGFLLQVSAAACLYRTTSTSPLFLIWEIEAATGQASSVRVDETRTIPPSVTLEGFCLGQSKKIKGIGEVFLQSTAGLESTRIVVRLVQ